jgi:hypothetical protein
MDHFSILLSSKQEIIQKFPVSRRFFQSGFELDPRNHEDNTLGLISLQQVIQLDLITGDIKEIA